MPLRKTHLIPKKIFEYLELIKKDIDDKNFQTIIHQTQDILKED